MSSEISHYELLGSEKGVRKLVDRFYDLMDEKEEVQTLRNLHAKSLRISREKLFLFLSGWLGGPPLYVEKYGHPRLRQRHMPFAIGSAESDQWLLCINQALDEQVIDDQFNKLLKDSFRKVAEHMVNK
ncbi:MAG TPA: hemoglobin-like protein [Leucothrix mucor]|nr:hemoglobin-like protein [Leucothrix mucor]